MYILPLFTENNVFRIAPLADEYQVTVIVAKCKTAMKSIVSKAQKTAASTSSKTCHLKPLRECFNVLKSALSLNYTDITDLSVNAVARFGYGLYNSVQFPRNRFSGYDLKCKISEENDETYADVRNECISLFESLPLEFRNNILSGRLERVDKEGEFM